MKKRKTNAPKEPRGQAKILLEIQSIQQQLKQINKTIPSLNKKPLWVKFVTALYISYREIASFGGILISAGTIYLSFSNFISVPPIHSLKANDPITIPILIENNSLINLKDINIEIELIKVEGDGKHSFRSMNNCSVFGKFPTLSANSSSTLVMNVVEAFGEKLITINEAEFNIIINYKALFFPKTFEEKFNFIALDKDNGLYEFYPNIYKK